MRRGLRRALPPALLPVLLVLYGAARSAFPPAAASGPGEAAATSPAPEAAPVPGTTAITITADELTVDADGVIVAAGRVRIFDGTTAAEGAIARVDPGRRTVLLLAGTVRGPQGVLRGRRVSARYAAARLIEVRAEGEAALELSRHAVRVEAAATGLHLADQVASASGDVRVRAGADLQARGQRLHYRLNADILSMAGPVRVEAGRGVAEGDRLEARVRRREVTLWGSVRLRVEEVAATAEQVVLLLPAQRAVLTGGVQVTQRGRTLWARRVTVDYGRGRVVAEGPLRLTIPQEEAP